MGGMPGSRDEVFKGTGPGASAWGLFSWVQVRGDGSDADLGQQWGVPMKA